MNSSSWLRSSAQHLAPHQSRIARRGNQQAMTFSTIPIVSMTNTTDRVEIITSVQRRRRWTASEKVRMVEETFEPGMTVSLVARRHGVAPNQLFTWRRLVAQGGMTAAGSGEEVVPASDYRALQNQVRELHRLRGKNTLEAEILKEALEHAAGSKKQLRLPPSLPKDGSR
jgi:transposase